MRAYKPNYRDAGGWSEQLRIFSCLVDLGRLRSQGEREKRSRFKTRRNLTRSAFSADSNQPAFESELLY
jgi:hypothetical protein